MYRNHIILFLVLLTILFNCLLTYGLLWNPYTLYFDRPEFSTTPFATRDFYAGATAITNFVILLGLTIVMVIKYWKVKRFFIVTPLFSLLTLFLLLQVQTFYPDAETEYTKDGYQYLEQRWYLKSENTFKKFRSDKPLSIYSGNHRAIIWQLDSISEGKKNE
jgi:hypothetical protein